MKYESKGETIQLLEVTLEEGESIVAEPGAMVYMESYINYSTVLGSPKSKSPLMGLTSMLTRKLSGESIPLAKFTNESETSAERKICFSAPYPGKIIRINLNNNIKRVYCQKGAFIAGSKGIEIGIGMHRNIGAGFFSENGFILQKLTGEGEVFVHAGGYVKEIDLHHDRILCDAGTIAAFHGNIEYDIKFVKNVKSMLFGGEGLALMELKGTGKIYIQSNPINRIADNIFENSKNVEAQILEMNKKIQKIAKSKK
ncbi:hypothetical protein A3715_15505 [Oleiphilus sp. HI0009]|nr:hypothetical protein A3715_15505 [Oleiphilus sp. HI0009]